MDKSTKEQRYTIGDNSIAVYNSKYLFFNKGECGILLDDFVSISKENVQFISTVIDDKKLMLDIFAVKGGSLVGHTCKPAEKGVRGGLKNLCEYLIVRWQEEIDDFEVV